MRTKQLMILSPLILIMFSCPTYVIRQACVSMTSWPVLSRDTGKYLRVTKVFLDRISNFIK